MPDSDTDVIISTGCPNYPIIEDSLAECNDLDLKPGASLTLNHDLDVHGHARVAGDLHMADEFSTFDVMMHFYCEPGCDLDMGDNTQVRVSGNLIVESGALVDPQSGSFIFEGPEGAGIQNHDSRTSLHNIENHKDDYGLQFSSLCTEDFTITGNLILLNDTELEGNSSYRVTLNGGIYKLPGSYFNFNAGEFIFENSNSNLTTTEMDYFNDLTLINSDIELMSDLYVNGDLSTISGYLNLWSYDLYLQGDWNNHAGPGVLGTSTGTVHFYSVSEDQALIGDTDIPTLHLQNWFGELYCPSGTINCENWHWSIGTLRINGAVFTAADIVTSTIQGSYIVNAGELNLHQDGLNWVDLNGGITITGGTMNIHGGYPIDSYWPYTQNAYITMSGGVLDFKDNGICLYDCEYTLTDIITGGTIRTSGSFTGLRHDFNPAGGAIELYGGSDVVLGHGIGSSFHDVRIDKTTSRDSRGDRPVALPELGKTGRKGKRAAGEQTLRYRHDGTSYPVSRMNSVSVVSTLDLDGDLIFSSGFFSPDSHVVDMDGDFDITGQLLMDADDYVRVGTDMLWRDGSLCSGSGGGEIHCEGRWIFYEGCNVPLLPGGTVVYMDGMNPGEIHNYSHSLNAQFGDLYIDKFQGNQVTLDDNGYSHEVVGTLHVNPGNTLNVQSANLLLESPLELPANATITVDAGGYIEGTNVTINGNLALGEGWLTVHDNFILDTYGSLTLVGGQVLCDRAYTGNFMSIAGALYMSDGLFEVTNDGLQFGGSNGSLISGGIIRLGGHLFALYENGLQPSGGLCEFTGGLYSSLECAAGNYLHNLTIDKSGGNVSTTNPLTVNGELHLINRTLDLNGNALTVAGDLLIETGGQLDPDEGSVSVGLNWTNLRGALGFLETNSSVTFFGDMPASIHNDESFFDLTVTKPTTTGYFFEIEDLLTVDVLGNLWISSGPLMLNEGVTLDVEGSIEIYGGAGLCAYPLFNGIEIDVGGSWFDYNSTYDYRVGFNPGTSVVTFDGTGEQWIETWPTAEFWDLTIDKASGTLYYQSNLWIQHDLNLLAGSLEGFNEPVETHYFEGDIYQAPGANFYDPNSSLCLTGAAEQLVDLQGTYQFYDLLVQKAEPEAQGEVTPSPAVKEADQTREERLEPAILQNDLALSGGLQVTSGTLQLNGHTLSLADYYECSIGTNGILNLSPDSQLLLGDMGGVYVMGRLELLGADTHPAILSRSGSGHYYCNVSEGGTLSAEYALFEYMDTQGINIGNYGNLDPVHTLHHCTFQQGPMFGTLLQINSTQSGLVIDGAHFPDNTWNGMFNVSRYIPQPPFETVTFAGATGGFSGEAWEDDPDGIINWIAGGDPDLSISDLYWSQAEAYPHDYVELYFTVENLGAGPSGQFTLGFYSDLAVPPTPLDTPDQTLIVGSIPAGSTYDGSFWATSETAAAWSAWLLADCLEEVAESDEGNNHGGPAPFTWQPLPAVTDLQIDYEPSDEVVTLTWSYPIWVMHFNVYRDTTPYFTPGPGNLIASPWETMYTEDATGEYYYLVTAYREMVVVAGEEETKDHAAPLKQ